MGAQRVTVNQALHGGAQSNRSSRMDDHAKVNLSIGPVADRNIRHLFEHGLLRSSTDWIWHRLSAFWRGLDSRLVHKLFVAQPGGIQALLLQGIVREETL